MGFKNQHLAWTGRVKTGRWGQGAVNSRGQRKTNELGRVVLALHSAALCQDAYYCTIMRHFCVSSRSQGGKATVAMNQAKAPNADILREISCLLTKRVKEYSCVPFLHFKRHTDHIQSVQSSHLLLSSDIPVPHPLGCQLDHCRVSLDDLHINQESRSPCPAGVSAHVVASSSIPSSALKACSPCSFKAGLV